MEGFQSELLARLPLAQAALRVFGYALDEPTLTAVFAEHRGRCYEHELRFANLVYLVRDALTLYQGSGNRAFTQAERAHRLPVARQNVYGKLSRLPEGLSMALLAVGAQRLGELLALAPKAVEWPAALAGMRLVPIDGKKLKGATKRLKALRDVAGALLGGKLLVALDLSSGLAAYRQRWGLEQVFQQVTEVFSLETLIGSAPRAMIFQAALCFLLYNMIQVVRAYVAEDGRQPVERVSSEKLFWDVREQLTTWKNLGDPETTVKALALGEGPRGTTAPQMAAWLRRRLAGCWFADYAKAPPKKKPAAPRPRATVAQGPGGHRSTWRVLQAAKTRRAGGQRS